MSTEKRGRPSKPRIVENSSERIGLALRTYRQLIGITGAEMAQALDVGGSTYDGYEAGTRRMTYTQVREAAHYLTFQLRMKLNSKIVVQPESIAIPTDEGLRQELHLVVAA